MDLAGRDAALLLSCPLLFAGKRISQKLQERRQEKTYASPKDPGGGGALVSFALFLLFFVGLWAYPMLTAFRCPTNGMLWGLLIFFCPPLGLVYLLVGCQGSALADKATTA